MNAAAQRAKYGCAVGDRIRLDFMGDDPCPIPAGTTGTVTNITDLGFICAAEAQASVQWDIPRSLSLALPEDKFTVIEEAP